VGVLEAEGVIRWIMLLCVVRWSKDYPKGCEGIENANNHEIRRHHHNQDYYGGNIRPHLPACPPLKDTFGGCTQLTCEAEEFDAAGCRFLRFEWFAMSKTSIGARIRAVESQLEDLKQCWNYALEKLSQVQKCRIDAFSYFSG
jgi:hypothetical protein